MVYVISKDGQPLMPMRRYGKVRRLLKAKKARIVRRCPFTIQLLFDADNNTTELTLGVDTGSSTMACAVVTPTNDVLYLSEVGIRNDITKKMTQRRTYRRTRRNRKTRYRKPRRRNRKNSKKKDRFSPTMRSKFHSHIKEIEFIRSILPVARIVIETGTFDVTLLNHSDDNEFNRHWGYQRGPNYGFRNAQEAVFSRDGYR